MRPYLAILKDSFREALASRVLWIVLALSTLLLAALAPFAVNEEAASALRRSDILSGRSLIEKLRAEGTTSDMSPGHHIWDLLPGEMRNRILKLDDDDSREFGRLLSDLRRKLNQLLNLRDFHDEASWEKIPASAEVRDLIDRGIDELDDQQLARLNRLLLDSAFPEIIDSAADSEVYVSYLGYKLGETLPFNPLQATGYIKEVLATLMSFLVGTVGVFIGVLVTASVIPHMFESGAIDLLLSKPISRSLLFLTKFFGGCVFVLINAAYFIFGMWLIVGWRFDIWSARFLMCIPVFLFLYAIYYSVSALAGVVWKNAIVSVIVAILFWATCFTVGQAKNIIESVFLEPTRLARLVSVGDTLFAANRLGQVFEWQAQTSLWEEVFGTQDKIMSRFPSSILVSGPVYNPQSDLIVAVEASMFSRRMQNVPGNLVIGRRSDDWQRVRGIATPEGTRSLFINPQGNIVVAGVSGIYEFQGDPTQEYKPFNLFGLDLAQYSKKKRGGEFVNVGPDVEERWQRPFAVAMNPTDGTLAIYTQGSLLSLNKNDDGHYFILQTIDLMMEEPVALAYSGTSLLVATESGDIRIFDTTSFSERSVFQPFEKQTPRLAIASTDGRWFAVLYHDRRLWIYDAERDQSTDLPLRGQGNISSAAFTPDNSLLVADRFDRVTEYSLNEFSIKQRYAPADGLLKLSYFYGVLPLYTVFPKPGELDDMVSYLITERESALPRGSRRELFTLQDDRELFDIWQPIISSSIFLIVVLGVSCVYIARKDY